MIEMIKKTLFLFMFAFSLSCLSPAYAQKPEEFINSLAQDAINSLTGKTIAQGTRQSRFRSFLVSHFDIKNVSKFSLGRYWRQATPEQQAEYQDLFIELVVRQYAGLFRKYSGEKLKIIGNAKPQGKNGYIVRTQIMNPKGQLTNVDWRLRQYGSKLYIIDVIVEGVSMAVTQREEITAVIQSNGGSISKLIETLRQKVGS